MVEKKINCENNQQIRTFSGNFSKEVLKIYGTLGIFINVNTIKILCTSNPRKPENSWTVKGYKVNTYIKNGQHERYAISVLVLVQNAICAKP